MAGMTIPMPPVSGRGLSSQSTNSQHSQHALHTLNSQQDPLSTYFGNYDFECRAMPADNYTTPSPKSDIDPWARDWDMESWGTADKAKHPQPPALRESTQPETRSADRSVQTDSLDADAVSAVDDDSDMINASIPQARLDEPVASEIIDFEDTAFDWGDSDDDDWVPPAPMFVKSDPAKPVSPTKPEIVIDFDAPMFRFDECEEEEWTPPAPMLQSIAEEDEEVTQDVADCLDEDEDEGEDFEIILLPPRSCPKFPSFDYMYEQGRIDRPIWMRLASLTPLHFEDDPFLQDTSYRRYHEVRQLNYQVTNWTGQADVLRKVMYHHAPDRGLSGGAFASQGTLIDRARTNLSVQLRQHRQELRVSAEIQLEEPPKSSPQDLSQVEFVLTPMNRRPPRNPGQAASRKLDTTPVRVRENPWSDTIKSLLIEWRGQVMSYSTDTHEGHATRRDLLHELHLQEKSPFAALEHFELPPQRGTPAQVQARELRPQRLDGLMFVQMIMQRELWDEEVYPVDLLNEIARSDTPEMTHRRWAEFLASQRACLNTFDSGDGVPDILDPAQIPLLKYDEDGYFLANTGPWAPWDPQLPSTYPAMSEPPTTFTIHEDSVSEISTDVVDSEACDGEGDDTITCIDATELDNPLRVSTTSSDGDTQEADYPLVKALSDLLEQMPAETSPTPQEQRNVLEIQEESASDALDCPSPDEK